VNIDRRTVHVESGCLDDRWMVRVYGDFGVVVLENRREIEAYCDEIDVLEPGLLLVTANIRRAWVRCEREASGSVVA